MSQNCSRLPQMKTKHPNRVPRMPQCWLLTCVLARSSCWKPSTSLLSSAALSWTKERTAASLIQCHTAEKEQTGSRYEKLGTKSIGQGDKVMSRKWQKHHEDAEHHVVVVDEEDELIPPGGELGCHLQDKILHLHLHSHTQSQ